MTPSQRTAIYDALTGDLSMFAADDPARLALEDSAHRQLNAIEPLMDAWLNEAWKAGLWAEREAS